LSQIDAYSYWLKVLPDPFAQITIDGGQMQTTTVIKKTLSPHWNEEFSL